MVPREEGGQVKYGLCSGSLGAEEVEVVDAEERVEELVVMRGRIRGMGPERVVGFVRCLEEDFCLRGVGRFSCESGADCWESWDICEGVSSSCSRMESAGGVITTQMKPTMRPEEHSWRKAMNSQN